MPKALVKKINDQSYDFTNDGEMVAYFYTMQKLLNHYMVKYKSLDPVVVKQKLSQLKSFMDENFKTLDDYLDKLDLLADFIGESNITAFSNFIGKQFLPVLENTKKSLLEREIPRYKDRYENPLRTPSAVLLEELESLFQKSPPLVWPPPNLSQQENSAIYNENGLPQGMQKGAQSHAQAMILNQVEGAPNAQDQKAKLLSEERSTSPDSMPGRTLLAKYEGEFIKAEPLALPLKSETISMQAKEEKKLQEKQEEEISNSVPKQVSFKEFVQLVNTISKFNKNKDMKAYNEWFMKLSPRFRASIHINQFFAKEQKGGEVDWDKQLKAIASQLYFEEKIIKKTKSEVTKYRPVLISLHTALQKLPNEGRQLYSHLVSLLDEEIEPDKKKNELKMILLQLTQPELKEKLLNEVSELIDKIG